MRDTIRNSQSMQSSNDQSLPRRTCASAIFRLSGDLARIVAAVAAAHSRSSPSSASSRCRISSTRSPANSRSMAARRAAIAPSPAGSAKAASVASTETLPHSASVRSAKRSERTWCVATPAATASAVLSRSPVSAHQVPSAPGIRGRNQVAPTSGKKPMPTSGIANEKRSPATRCDPCTDTPTPPPITMPSISATYGLG